MTSTQMLTELGERIAVDGPAAHDCLLQHVSALVVDTAPGAAAALADRHAPEVVRQRALAVATAVLLRSPTGSRVAFQLTSFEVGDEVLIATPRDLRRETEKRLEAVSP